MSANWVAVDVDTANDWPGSICAVGLTAVERGRITGRFSILVRPPGTGEFTRGPVRSHDVTRQTVQDAPSWPVALEEILAFAGGRPLVAHHAAFVFGAFRAACTLTGTPWPALKYGCSELIARQTWRLLAYGLPFVAGAAGVVMPNRHRDAEAEATATARITVAAMDLHDVDSLDMLLTKLHLVYGRQGSASGAWHDCRHRSPGRRPLVPHAHPDADPDGMLYGRTVCLTGTPASMLPGEAAARVTAAGGRVVAGVNRLTDILVVATPDPGRFTPGSVLGEEHRKAQQLLDGGHDIEVISEAELLAHLSLAETPSGREKLRLTPDAA